MWPDVSGSDDQRPGQRSVNWSSVAWSGVSRALEPFVQRPLLLTIRAGEPTAWEQMVRMGISRTTVPSIRAVPLPQAALTAMGLPAGIPGCGCRY